MKNKKDNWLLFLAGASFILYIFFSLFYFDEEIISSRAKMDVSLPLFIIAAILAAPIIEELCFRGVFAKAKWLKIVSLLALPLFLILNEINYWYLGGLFILYLLLLLQYILKLKILQQVAMFVSAILFGIMHYQLSDFNSIVTAYLFLIQFAVGLMLIWLTLNYNILRAMLFHFGWNFMAITVLVLYIQFPDVKKQTFENEKIKVEWQRIPYFDSENPKIKGAQNRIEAENADINMLKRLLKFQKIDLQKDITGAEPYMKYNMEIRFKDTISIEAITQFLEAEDLIYPAQ